MVEREVNAGRAALTEEALDLEAVAQDGPEVPRLADLDVIDARSVRQLGPIERAVLLGSVVGPMAARTDHDLAERSRRSA
jgi:hypothetical protein